MIEMLAIAVAIVVGSPIAAGACRIYRIITAA